MLKDLAKRSGRITVGADKAYDVAGLVSVLRELNVTPHVIQNNKNRRSAIDGRTTRQVGYGISLGKRWLVEKAFGWLKQTAPLRKLKLRGLPKVDWLFLFSCAAFNLLRIPKLRIQCACTPTPSADTPPRSPRSGHRTPTNLIDPNPSPDTQC